MEKNELWLLERQAEICRALGSPKRLQIVYLLKAGEMAAGDLAAALETTPANASQHLAAMKAAGIVESRREGSNILYALACPEILEACDTIRHVLSQQFRRGQDLLGQATGETSNP